METLLDLLRNTHVAAGFIGLATFWVPIFTRKGAKYHRLFGKIFKYCAYIVLGAAFISVSWRLIDAFMSGIGPAQYPSNFAFIVFLGYLTVVTFIGLRHGIAVLENKRELTDMDTPLNNGFAWLAFVSSLSIIAYGLYFAPPNKILLFALSPIGFANWMGIRAAIKGRLPDKKAWFYEHMGAMMGTGIAFHTAFAVFGASQIFDLGLEGWIAVIPWIAPALIGIPATVIWTRYYKKKFGDLVT